MSKLGQARKKAKKHVHLHVLAAVALSWIPGSAVWLSALDHSLMKGIAKSYGVEEKAELMEMLTLLAVPRLGKMAAESLSFLPGGGWVVKAIIAGILTKAAGEAAIHYGQRQSPLQRRRQAEPEEPSDDEKPETSGTHLAPPVFRTEGLGGTHSGKSREESSGSE